MHFPKHFQPAIFMEKFNGLTFQRTELHDLHGVQGCNLPECKSPTFPTLPIKNPTFWSLPITTFFNSFSLLWSPPFSDKYFQYRDYFWNDSDCKNDVAHYICVKVTLWKNLFHNPGKLFSQYVTVTKRRYPSKCSSIKFFRTVLTAPSREQLPQSSFDRKSSLVLWSWCWLSVQSVFQ